MYLYIHDNNYVEVMDILISLTVVIDNVYLYKNIKLYTLNINNVTCQLNHKKAEKLYKIK